MEKKRENAELAGCEYAILKGSSSIPLSGLQFHQCRDNKLGCCAIRDVTQAVAPLHQAKYSARLKGGSFLFIISLKLCQHFAGLGTKTFQNSKVSHIISVFLPCVVKLLHV